MNTHKTKKLTYMISLLIATTFGAATKPAEATNWGDNPYYRAAPQKTTDLYEGNGDNSQVTIEWSSQPGCKDVLGNLTNLIIDFVNLDFDGAIGTSACSHKK